MFTRVTHVVTSRTPENALRQLALLLRRLPADRFPQQVVAVGSEPPVLARLLASMPAGRGPTVLRVSGRWGLPGGQSSEWRRLLPLRPPEVWHAWGTAAASVARAACPADAVLVVTVTDPEEIGDVREWWPLQADPGIRGAGRVLCASEWVQNQVIGLGIPREATALVRPGIEGHSIDTAGRDALRAELHLPADARVLLTASPPSRAGGQFFAAWAAAILYQIWPNVRLVCTGRSRELDRIRRLIEGIYCPDVFRLVGDDYSPDDLFAISDLLVAPATDDISTWWLASAMLAGVPVVASGVPSLAEVVADERTGFVCRPVEPHTLAIRIREAAESGGRLAGCVAEARRWATEAFDADRCVEAHAAVYAPSAGSPADGAATSPATKTKSASYNPCGTGVSPA
ncbi:MAG TPA: glycosyltransferase family 4 protein [Phycisphaerae bacterium]|nr:glycosyltransferase family 4 protein [Phycisphaerae bacterium]